MSVLRDRKAYAEKALADPGLSANRRRILEAKLAEYDSQLASRCGRCGRELTASESQTAGVGPVCAHRAA